LNVPFRKQSKQGRGLRAVKERLQLTNHLLLLSLEYILYILFIFHSILVNGAEAEQTQDNISDRCARQRGRSLFLPLPRLLSPLVISMRGLPFPSSAQFDREPSDDHGSPSNLVNDIPIDPALEGPAVDPVVVSEGVNPLAAHVSAFIFDCSRVGRVHVFLPRVVSISYG
jgi:hypothetical protein